MHEIPKISHSISHSQSCASKKEIPYPFLLLFCLACSIPYLIDTIGGKKEKGFESDRNCYTLLMHGFGSDCSLSHNYRLGEFEGVFVLLNKKRIEKNGKAQWNKTLTGTYEGKIFKFHGHYLFFKCRNLGESPVLSRKKGRYLIVVPTFAFLSFFFLSHSCSPNHVHGFFTFQFFNCFLAVNYEIPYEKPLHQVSFFCNGPYIEPLFVLYLVTVGFLRKSKSNEKKK